jgi:uncharacterized RmlC-like cupin family protein
MRAASTHAADVTPTSLWNSRAKWRGLRGEFAATATVDNVIHAPAFLPHMEINSSDSEPFRWVVVRSTPTPIVVNLPDDTWPQMTARREKPLVTTAADVIYARGG